jgi:outer membrane receptor protein involved in Fe transport
MNRIRTILVSCAALAVCCSAQSSRGTVNGLVDDPTGAVIPGAKVELKGVDTGTARSTTTNESGAYRFDAVDLGDYVVTITSAGFQIYQTQPFSVVAGQVRTVDCRLEVGEQKTVVQVEATAATLQVEAPVRGANIETQDITDLPFAARNPVSLALNVPGVSSNRTTIGVSTFVVNGARGRSNNFLIDGTENNDISVAGQAFQITNPDAIQEVSVQTSNFDSEFGRAGGGVVNVITKAGTNAFHGTASLLLDVTNDDAVTYLQSLDPSVQARGRQLPGTDQWWSGTIGGPIRKNRTFFFQSFQQERQRSSGSADVTAPSAAGRATLNSLFPKGTNPRVDLFNQITGGTDAAADLFPVALGNGRPAIEFGTAIFGYPQTFQDTLSTTRIDHTFNERNLLSGRFLYDNQSVPVAAINWPGFITSQQNRYMNAMVAYTRVFSPSLTNELRLPYNRITLGFPNDPANPLGATMPLYDIRGIVDSGVGVSIGGYFGVQTNLPQGRVANNYGLQDTVSWVHGTHSVRMGADLLLQRSRQYAPIIERGYLRYQAGGGFTGFANYIDDFGGSAGQARLDFGNPAYYPDLFRQAYFIQDRWRATRDLTLTLGVRYEYFGLPMNTLRTSAYTGLFNVDPVTFTGPYSQPSQVNADRNNFSPGIGLTYSPGAQSGLIGSLLGDRKTVIRAGYQIGYDSFYNNIASNAATSSPNAVATQLDSNVSTALPRGVANLSQQLPQTARPLTPQDGQTLIDPNLRNPYYERWSFGIQRELGHKTVLDVSYVGSHGVKLFATEQMNPILPLTMRIFPANADTAPASRIGTRYDVLQGTRNIRTNNGASSYNALQALLSRRYANGLSGSFSYTWSKLLDYGSEIFAVGNTPANAAVPPFLGGLAAERALSLFDRTHRAVLALNYELPFYRTGKGALAMIAGGWALGGIYTYESGIPINILNGLDADGIDGANDRPLFNPNGAQNVRAIPNASSPTGYVNPDVAGSPAIDPATAMFVALPANTGTTRKPTGNLGRDTFRSNPLNNVNFNAFKRFRITERFSAEFRAEFYNALNHQQRGVGSVSPFAASSFSTPSANVVTSGAGRFLNQEVLDGGGRVIRYQIKFLF